MRTLSDSEKRSSQKKKKAAQLIDIGGDGASAVWVGPVGCLVAT